MGLEGTVAAPGQIIRVADSARAGKRQGGRVHSATTTKVTVDNAPTVAVGDTLTVIMPDGVSQTRTVSAVSGKVITVSTAFTSAPLAESVWTVESSELAAQTYRVLAVTEDKSDENISFTITALQHNASKFSAVDSGTSVIIPPISALAVKAIDAPASVTIAPHQVTVQGVTQTTITISWDAVSGAISYDVEYRRDDGGWVSAGSSVDAQSVDVPNVYTGSYKARVRARNTQDNASVWTYSNSGAATAVEGKTTPPPAPTLTVTGGFLQIDATWAFPTSENIDDTAYTEIASSASTSIGAGKLYQFAYPQSSAAIGDVGPGETRYLWARLVDTSGNVGDWSAIVSATAQTTNEMYEPALDAIDAVQTQADGLRTDVDQTIADLGQEVTDRTTAISNEANARATALLNEKNAREAAITAEQTIRQSADDSLAVTISQVAAGTGEQFDPAKIWYFDSTVEGWTGNGAPTIVDGWMRPANSTNPWVQCAPGLAVSGQSYRFVKLRLKKIGTPTGSITLTWRLQDESTWTGTVMLPEPAYDSDGVAVVVIQDIEWWPGTIDRIGLTLSSAQTDTDYILIDWIAIGRPTPGAGVAALQDEAAARVTADSAEATQRSTLATQMRGNYTGTDVAAVTSGLVYSERQARSSADGALATRAAALEARMPSGTGTLATSASVSDEASARANADGALSTRTGAMEARMPSGTGALATSASVSDEASARATADTAMASDIALLGAHNADKTAFNLNSSSVKIDGGQTLAQTISGLQAADGALSGRVDSEQTARVAGDTANANNILAMQARMDARGANLIEDGSFEANLWVMGDGVAYVDNSATPWVGCTGNTYVHSNARASVRDCNPSNASIDVEPGRTYRIRCTYETNSAYNGTSANGKLRLGDQSDANVANFGWKPNTRETAEIVYTVPASVSALRVSISFDHSAGWCRVDDVSCYDVTDATANASAINATNVTVSTQGDDIEANATQISNLTTTVGGHTASISTLTSTTNGLKAQAVMVMDVDGRLSGMKANATATESDITFLFDAVNFVSEDGTASIEGGRFITRSNGFMSVIGQPFGVGSEFIEWYGPELPLASCSRSNAITYKTKTGALYVKQIFVGARTFSAYNPYAAAAQEIALQVNDTAGGNISVALNYTRSVTQTGAGTTFSAGSGTAAAQVTLYRKVGTGAETLVGTYNYTGGVDVLNVPDGLSRATTYVTGSSTFVDTTNNLQPRRYRAVVVSSTLQGVNYTGTAPAVQPEAGNLGLTSTE